MRNVKHGPKHEQIADGIPEQVALEAAAELALEGSVAGTLPTRSYKGIRHLLHRARDLHALGGGGHAAREIRMEAIEPRMGLIVGAERVMAVAVRAHAPGDEAGHRRDRCAFQEPLGQPSGLGRVNGIPAAAGAFAGRRQIQAREHRPILDRAPPADGVRPAQGAVLGGG